MSGFQLITLSCYVCGLRMLHSPCVQYRICTHFYGAKLPWHPIKHTQTKCSHDFYFVIQEGEYILISAHAACTKFHGPGFNHEYSENFPRENFSVYGIVWCDISWWLCYIHACTQTHIWTVEYFTHHTWIFHVHTATEIGLPYWLLVANIIDRSTCNTSVDSSSCINCGALQIALSIPCTVTFSHSYK